MAKSPILISFSRRLVIDRLSTVLGIASVRMKLMGWTAPTERKRSAVPVLPGLRANG